MEMTFEMQLQYLLRRRTDLEKLKSVLFGRSDGTTLQTIGHQLKGNAKSFGFDELTAVAEKLEEAGRRSDWQQAEKIIAEFEVWLDSRQNSFFSVLPETKK